MDVIAVDLEALERRLAESAGRPLVVHHFATWCDPCEEELPILVGLIREIAAFDAASVAVAWDLFLTPVGPEAAARAVTGFLARHGAAFDAALVYTGTPDALFASQKIDNGTVPCTEVRDRAGVAVARFPGPLFEEQEQRRFVAAVESAARRGGREQ